MNLKQDQTSERSEVQIHHLAFKQSVFPQQRLE